MRISVPLRRTSRHREMRAVKGTDGSHTHTAHTHTPYTHTEAAGLATSSVCVSESATRERERERERIRKSMES